MISLVTGLIAAVFFLLDALGVKWAGHSLTTVGLFFLAVAVAFLATGWGYYGRRRVQ